MRCKALRQGFFSTIVGILILSTMGFAQSGLSHVRVVRLSYVSGTVGVKRPASTEWAKAQVNIPIQEGFELSTSAQSYAEVEFENGSTARLGEFSKVSFDQLAMDGSGNKLNRLTFTQGYATFHLLPEHHDAYSVKIAESTLKPNGKCEFRTDLERGRMRVEVFSGSLDLATSERTVKLGKDKVVEFDPEATQLALNQKQGIVKDSWDKWTSERDTQAQLSVTDQAVPSRGLLYGYSDLNAYGEWGYFPGFGYGWSPYVSAGWSPYSMGMWNMYPGMGYTWTSSEPWGWLPYHYGSWGFSPGFGWLWMMSAFDASFSPAMVNWYSGPGWIGWAPLGVMGAAGQNIVTTTPGSVVQNGVMISPQNVNHVPLRAGTLIRSMPFQPGAGAMLPGERLSASPEALFTPPAGATHTSAPASILMGGDPEKEQSLLQAGHSAHQPLRVHLGTTLGGHYAVGGSVGEFRGDAFSGAGGVRGQKGMQGSPGPAFSRNASSGGPVLLPHGQKAASSPEGGGSGPMPMGGGSYGGSVPSAATSSVSTGHTSAGQSGGGGHH
jgi:hypothetical protein